MNIPIAKTFLSNDEIESVLEPLRSGWLVQGVKVQEFENAWSDFTGAKHSIAVTSCTSALHLSLVALGFGPGDEAIVPAFTWVATANVVELMGGKVVFCDIDLDTFNIDINQLEEKITKRTKAILPVHLFGRSADMFAIREIADRHGLVIVEDAACGFGAYYHGRHVGALGDTGCFSFHPRKAITTGEGGMITTDSDPLADKLRRLRDHGAAISDLQRHLGAKPYLLADHPVAGFNQRMTDIQGALGAAQMRRADSIISERRFLADKYGSALKALSWLAIPQENELYRHGYQSYPCLFSPQELNVKSISAVNSERNLWMDQLLALGISTRPATHAVHMLSHYRNRYGHRPEDFTNAWIANDCSISFPLFNGMTEAEQQYVIEKILEANF